MTSKCNDNSKSFAGKRVGRPRVAQKRKFINVAIPTEVHGQIKDLAWMENRTIARQLKTLIERAHAEKVAGRIFN